jgi:hypothetical protein
MRHVLILVLLAVHAIGVAQNTDPSKAEIITSDIELFWKAYDASLPNYSADVFQHEYIDKGSNGVKGFLWKRIESGNNLSKVISRHPRYYASIRESTGRIAGMEDQIRQSLAKLKEYYPAAVFPPVYFVIGALSSGGTTSKAGLIIGAEMYGRTPSTSEDELSPWLKTVLKPVDEVPHVVAHELIHFQQDYDGGTLLQACLKEGSADFLAELVSGKHINQHVHDFANPKERELWEEFQERMNKKNYNGWLYGTSGPGRPQDLGYWMGYQITKAYFDRMADKKQAVFDILHIHNPTRFLEASSYADRFK